MKRERERQKSTAASRPKDSYANEAEMRCEALIYARVARDSLCTDPRSPQ